MEPSACATFDDLGDAELELIFAAVCTTPRGYRHCPGLPVVCRRWRDVYEQSTVLWQEVRLDWDVCRVQAGETACARAAHWLLRRLPICRRLLLTGWPDFGAALQSGDSTPPLAQLFPSGLSGPRLEEVRFVEMVGGSGNAALGLLRDCPKLHSLAVAGPQSMMGRVAALVLQGEALAPLSSLHSLRSLDLLVDKMAGSMRELGSALSRLTNLALRCRLEATAVAPEWLEGLSQLRRLELASVRLAQFTPRLAQALSGLTYLSCSDVLAARAGGRRAGITLWQGLRHLASLQEFRCENQGVGPVRADMPLNALVCSSLRRLTLMCTEVADWPRSMLQSYTGRDGCLGALQSLHLVSLVLRDPIPPAIWPALAPALTCLVWRDIRKPRNREAILQLAEAQAAGELAEGAEAFQAVPLPPELSRLQKLRELRVEYAQLDAVPPVVQALTQLTRLSLEGNRLSSLPEGQYLTGLQALSLANNEFSELPDGLAACSSLQELWLTGNAIVLTHAAVERLADALPYLESLHLNPLPPHPASVPALNASEGGMWHEHGQALGRLVQWLGQRLVMEQ